MKLDIENLKRNYMDLENELSLTYRSVTNVKPR